MYMLFEIGIGTSRGERINLSTNLDIILISWRRITQLSLTLFLLNRTLQQSFSFVLWGSSNNFPLFPSYLSSRERGSWICCKRSLCSRTRYPKGLGADDKSPCNAIRLRPRGRRQRRRRARVSNMRSHNARNLPRKEKAHNKRPTRWSRGWKDTTEVCSNSIVQMGLNVKTLCIRNVRGKNGENETQNAAFQNTSRATWS